MHKFILENHKIVPVKCTNQKCNWRGAVPIVVVNGMRFGNEKNMSCPTCGSQLFYMKEMLNDNSKSD